MFVYRQSTNRITRYPLHSLRPAKSTTVKNAPRNVWLLAGPSSSESPVWAVSEQQIHAFHPITLDNAGISLLKEDDQSERLPARSPRPKTISPDGTIIPCSRAMGRLVNRNLRLAQALIPGNTSHARLSPDGIHYVHDGQLQSSIEKLPRRTYSNGRGAVAIDRDLWWCTADREHHRLLIRSGTTERVLLEVRATGRNLDRVFISFKHKRLAVTNARTNSVLIYPFDLEAIDKELSLPIWIETSGSLILPHRKPSVFKLHTNGPAEQMILTTHPEGATLKNGILRWTPPEVSKAALFRFTVKIPEVAIRSFTLFVVPDTQ